MGAEIPWLNRGFPVTGLWQNPRILSICREQNLPGEPAAPVHRPQRRHLEEVMEGLLITDGYSWRECPASWCNRATSMPWPTSSARARRRRRCVPGAGVRAGRGARSANRGALGAPVHHDKPGRYHLPQNPEQSGLRARRVAWVGLHDRDTIEDNPVLERGPTHDASGPHAGVGGR
jgi:hypothetical protein